MPQGRYIRQTAYFIRRILPKLNMELLCTSPFRVERYSLCTSLFRFARAGQPQLK